MGTSHALIVAIVSCKVLSHPMVALICRLREHSNDRVQTH